MAVLNEILINQIPMILAVITGVLLLFYLLYRIITYTGNGSGSSKSYKSSVSLDKLYDLAKGNDPLSEARLTSKIDISTDANACGFLVTYKGVKDRTIECYSGCNSDKTDENSNFCKQFIYPGTGTQKDTMLDSTFVNRREASR